MVRYGHGPSLAVASRPHEALLTSNGLKTKAKQLETAVLRRFEIDLHSGPSPWRTIKVSLNEGAACHPNAVTRGFKKPHGMALEFGLPG